MKRSGGDRFIIFTDLDGTLLDNFTYQWQDAREAIELCKSKGIPVVLVSSKTKDEIDAINREMGLCGGYVVENGAAIYIFKNCLNELPYGATDEGRYWRITLGVKRERLIEELRNIREDLNLDIEMLSEMSDSEIERHTKLRGEDLKRIRQRQFSEPFVFSSDNMEKDEELLKIYAKERGLRVIRGGRFFHIHGDHDKSDGVNIFISLFSKIIPNLVSVALGDSPNDLGMLKAVDIAYLFDPKQRWKEYIQKEGVDISKINIIKAQGPSTWNKIIKSLIERR